MCRRGVYSPGNTPTPRILLSYSLRCKFPLLQEAGPSQVLARAWSLSARLPGRQGCWANGHIRPTSLNSWSTSTPLKDAPSSSI